MSVYIGSNGIVYDVAGLERQLRNEPFCEAKVGSVSVSIGYIGGRLFVLFGLAKVVKNCVKVYSLHN